MAPPPSSPLKRQSTSAPDGEWTVYTKKAKKNKKKTPLASPEVAPAVASSSATTSSAPPATPAATSASTPFIGPRPASPPATPSEGPTRFKVQVLVGHPIYDTVTSLSKDPRLKFTVKPNRYGDLILHTKDPNTVATLTRHQACVPLKPLRIKALVLHYPVGMPLNPVLDLPDVTEVTRCLAKGKEPIRKLIVTFRGDVPERIHLGVWGSYPTAPFTPEPLRCYRCHKFGHHRERCTAKVVCGVCSENHDTSVCLDQHKAGNLTLAKCPNCSKSHHAWSRHCPVRLEQIHISKARSAPPPAAAPADTAAPVPISSRTAFPSLPAARRPPAIVKPTGTKPKTPRPCNPSVTKKSTATQTGETMISIKKKDAEEIIFDVACSIIYDTRGKSTTPRIELIRELLEERLKPTTITESTEDNDARRNLNAQLNDEVLLLPPCEDNLNDDILLLSPSKNYGVRLLSPLSSP